jgi:hypothetical protein
MTAETAPSPADDHTSLGTDSGVPSTVARSPNGLGRPLTAIVVAQAVWLWWAFSKGWFLQADLSNLVDGLGRRPDWSYLTGQIGGHFAPVARLVYWVFDELSPLDYGLAVALRVGCQAISTILLYRLLIRLATNEYVVIAVVALYAFNPLLLAGTAMFTPGITIGIGQVFTLLALTAHVRYEQTYLLRWAAAAGGLLGVAVLCSEQWVVVTLAFPILSAVHFYAGTVRQRIMRLVRTWRAWVLLAAPVLIAGLGVLAFAEPTGAASPSLTASYRLLRNSWLYSLAPSWIGGPLQWFADSTTYIAASAPSDLVVLLGQIGVALTVVIGVQRNGRASVAGWLLPVGVWALSMLLVGYRGFSQLQDLVAITPRYLSALIPMFAIGAALALSPRGVARAEPTDADTRPQTPAHNHAARRFQVRGWDAPRAVTAALVVAVLATSLVSGFRFSQIFGRSPSQQYVENLTNSARVVGPTVNLYDTPVPAWLISPVEPNHRVTDLLRLAGAKFRTDDPSSRPLIAAPDGRLVKSVFVPAAAVLATPPCGSAVHGAGTFTFPLNRPAPPGAWYLHLQLFQQSQSTVTVELINSIGAIRTPVRGRTLHLNQLADISLRLPYFAPTAVRFHSSDPSTSLCLTVIQVGAPFPVAGS